MVCQLEVLRQCFPSSVRGVLAELPESLDETYERILQKIPKPNRVHAHRLLQCIAVAASPLFTWDLAEILAIDFSAPGTAPVVVEDEERAVLSACSSLITIVKNEVQFSHFSVKEFLTSDRLATSTVDTLQYYHVSLEAAHTAVAQVCLSALLRLDNDMDIETIWGYPLTYYASRHFGDHVEFENVLSNVSDGVNDLLDPDKPHFYTWVWLQIGDWDPLNWVNLTMDKAIYLQPCPIPSSDMSGIKPKRPPRLPPLYYIAAFGHSCLAHHLFLNRPQGLHISDDEGCTPLHIAVLAGKDTVSRLLIKHFTDSDIRDVNYRSLLHMTSYNGLLDIARILLERDGPIKSYVNSRDKEGQTPLHFAVKQHHTNIVALLLKFGADVNAQDDYHITPLHGALEGGGCIHGHASRITETVQLLVNHGSSVQMRNKDGQTTLHLASLHGYPSIVALLLKLGADVDTRDNDTMTPLLLASQRWVRNNDDDSRATKIVHLLVEHGASIHVRNWRGQTPLHLASQRGHSSIVAFLLKLGVDVDAQDHDAMTPLLLAPQEAFSDHHEDLRITKTAQVLLEQGASVHMRNRKGQTPLHLASQHGHSSIVALLLKSGADVDAQDNYNETPLLLSPRPGWGDYKDSQTTKTAQLLLEHGANVRTQNKNGQTLLHLASQHGNSGVVALLLKSDMNVDAMDNDNITPLHLTLLAQRCGSSYFQSQTTKTVQLLLENGASVHVGNKKGQTLLHLASQRGQSDIVLLLLKLGMDVDALDNDIMTPLLEASHQKNLNRLEEPGITKTVQLLLEYGASVLMRNRKGQTPLHLSSGSGNLGVMALLLKFGADVDALDNDKMTPFHLASGSHVETFAAARILLEHGASFHARNYYGQTPLHLASQHSNPRIILLLLKQGAHVDATDENRRTPLLLASGSDFWRDDDSRITESAQLLLEYGASVHVWNVDGQTPLHLASQRHHSGIVKLLLQFNAEVDPQVYDVITPLRRSAPRR